MSCILTVFCFLATRLLDRPVAPEQRYEQAIARLTRASTEEEKFYVLGKAAKDSFDTGKFEQARTYANELAWKGE
jgi:hypothetical protein